MDAVDRKTVLVSIVTYNDERFLGGCLEAVFGQTAPVRVKVFDNASRDSSRQVARRFPVSLTASRVNLGFAEGHNANFEGEDFELGLLLNADAILDPGYLERLLPLFQRDRRVGMAGGKLWRMADDGTILRREGKPVLDSTGIYFTPSQRHFDRGSSQPDRHQFDRREWVFGITGAALLFHNRLRRDLLECNGHFLDARFFAYREDADLAWRALLRGWRAVYEPAAQARHYRKVLPSGRRRVAGAINYHSVKNRFLMRRKNIDWAVRVRCFPFMWLRDLGIFAYLVILERGSLPALVEVWKLRPVLRSRRRLIQSSRRISAREMSSWFGFRPRVRAWPVAAGTTPGRSRKEVAPTPISKGKRVDP